MQQATTIGLQERQDTPQILTTSAESFNAMRNNSVSNVNSPDTASMPISHVGCGYNVLTSKDRSMSPKHTVFVLGIDGKPLTPTTPRKAYKLMKGRQAKPIWNKYGKFGIQLQVQTRTETPKTAMGCDYGTKFEGYAVAVGKENNLSVMWKLPDKKNLVRKMKERRQLRRARRQRNCRRRECRSNNRNKDSFIAPSQMVMIQSRQKAMREFFKCYPIDAVAIENVRFNHKKHRWGKNFSTIEVGKKSIYNWVKEQSLLRLYQGHDTQDLRKIYGYKKSKKKNAEVFNAHCSDALTIAVDVFVKHHIEPDNFVVVDDTYRCVRRKLHDAQFSKGGIRYIYSTGNYRGIRKGTMCEFGQICGGTKKMNVTFIRNSDNKRISKVQNKIEWLSHSFKTKHIPSIHLPFENGGFREGRL